MMNKKSVLPKNLPVLEEADLSGRLGLKFLRQGKVRDLYLLPDGGLALVATDRISAFDRVLGTIPGKGAVLTGIARYWFENTADIIPNHLSAVPDPNVMIVRQTKPLPVEVVVRGYMTGSTGTSIWGSYARGERVIYGLPFRDGYRKNEPLDYPIITPTTKAESGHDQRITEEAIIKSGLVPVSVWQQVRQAALALFARGQAVARQRGFLLFDTKFEFGVTSGGQVLLIDEALTPDSSRYAKAGTLEACLSSGREPDFYDKEFFRLALIKSGYRGEGKAPPLPEVLRKKLALRYAEIHEALTGSLFIPPAGSISDRMNLNLATWLLSREREKLVRQQQVVIIMGSPSDRAHVGKITDVLTRLGISFQTRVGSAHKTPKHVLSLIAGYDTGDTQNVYIAVAGRSNALGGFLAANTCHPVINAPPPGEPQTVFSSLEMPGGVEGVMVLYPEGAALAAAKILALTNPVLAEKISNYQEKNRRKILEADRGHFRK